MTQTTAEVHLKRAYGFLKEVEKATEEFRRRAIEHDAQMEANEPFLQGLVGAVRGSRQLSQQKSSLVGDLQLANQELDKAAALNLDATIETPDGRFGIKLLRALIMFSNAQLETFWGSVQKAKQLFSDSLQIFQFPDPHYMLGLLCESEYRPAEALAHFEKCLELDPDGELSVPALREANAMRNYKKTFRGSWGVFLLLLVFFFPAAFVYLIVKWKERGDVEFSGKRRRSWQLALAMLVVRART